MNRSYLLRIAALALALALFLCACGEAAPAASSAAASSASAGSKAASSVSSQAGHTFLKPDPATGDLNIDDAVKAAGFTDGNDVSACFDTAAKRYIVNGGPYLVDRETLFRLTEANVTGTGSVKWVDWDIADGVAENPDNFDGIIPVAKLRDPIFCSMALPSDAQTYMEKRVNGSNMYLGETRHNNICGIGAVYRNDDVSPLPDNTEVTVCLGRITILLYTEKLGWFVGNTLDVPQMPKMYSLPWSGSNLAVNDRVQTVGDHMEVSLTAGEFNGGAFKAVNGKEGCLHFWGEHVFFHYEKNGHPAVADARDITGVVVAFQAWIKEPENSGKFAAAIGADWRTSANSGTDQCFSGRNFLLTDQPRWVIGHNVGPKAYDKLIKNTDTIQSLLGMK